jgi:uncharacterized membrane protein YhdT
MAHCSSIKDSSMSTHKTDSRFAQANREALLALGAYGLYFIWWYVCAYGLGDGDPDTYTYVLGLPAWFFYSCIVGYPLVVGLLWVMVRVFFKDIPLDDEAVEQSGTDEPPRKRPATTTVGSEAS